MLCEDGIYINTTPVDKHNYIVEIANPYTKRSIAVEYYTKDEMSEHDIGLTVFRDLITSSALGMVNSGTYDRRDFYKSSLQNMKHIGVSEDDIWEGIDGDDCTMFNA